MAESAIDRTIKHELTRRRAWAIKTHGTTAGRRGIPDWLACHHGIFLAVETKQPTGRLEPLQRHELERIQRAGGRIVVARSADDVRHALDLIDQAAAGRAA